MDPEKKAVPEEETFAAGAPDADAPDNDNDDEDDLEAASLEQEHS